jgi:hypothetical protein
MSRHIPPNKVQVFTLAAGRPSPARQFRGNLVKDDGHPSRRTFDD